MRTQRTDTSTTASPWRLRRIFKPRQHRVDDSTFFAGELDSTKDPTHIMAENMRKQGLVPKADSQAFQIVLSAFSHVQDVFSGEVVIPDISYVCTYDMAAQPKGASSRTADAVAYFTTNGETKLYGLAVSVQAICKGGDYLLFVIIHELAHIILEAAGKNGEMSHDEVFEAYLLELLRYFNEQTGKHLKNDFSGYGET
ncbi:MAG: hypothetical protein IJQ45_02665 [Clostridia bacterium]|nr:hypothetical protein [Clostridia bacterium]